MAGADRATLGDLQERTAAAWAAVDDLEGDVTLERIESALAAILEGWLVSQYTHRIMVDVNLLDPAVHACRETLWYASRWGSLLFPPSELVLRVMTVAARAHLARFPYRQDLGDVDEAQFLANQVLVLKEELTQDAEDIASAAHAALAEAALWRFRVTGKPTDADAALAEARTAVAVESVDIITLGLLAECLVEHAKTRDIPDALNEAAEAQQTISSLLKFSSEHTENPALRWFESGWAATSAHAALLEYELTGQYGSFEAAERAADWGCYRTYPSTPEAEDALLATMIAGAPEDVSAELESAIADEAEVVVAAASGRYWFAMQGTRRHAEWQLPRKWTQPATNSARIFYDCVDQILLNQSGDRYRTAWLPWMAQGARLAAPALAEAGFPGPAASRLEQSRSRILADRFADDAVQLADLPPHLQHLADPIVVNRRTLRDPRSSRSARAFARDAVLRAVSEVRSVPGYERFLWKLEPEPLLELAESVTVVYLTPGPRQGVAVLGGAAVGDWVSIALPGCPIEPPAVVTRFVETVLSPHSPAGARRRTVAPLVNWLGENVWEPLTQALNDVTQVWVIPGGYLAPLPIHAGTLNGGQPALARWDIRHAVSLRTLTAARDLPLPGPRNVRFLGLPQPAAQERLGGAANEITAVAHHFDGAIVLDPAEMTVDRALRALGEAGYLHAACHGIADRDDPERSGLELGDGRLMLGDLTPRQATLELAVLSACETMVPDVRHPDEAMSLATGLHLAGTRGLIASSWRVPDEATAELMGRFYRAWRGPEAMTITESLRTAQLALAATDEWREPYYWAGFSFLGFPTS